MMVDIYSEFWKRNKYASFEEIKNIPNLRKYAVVAVNDKVYIDEIWFALLSASSSFGDALFGQNMIIQ